MIPVSPVLLLAALSVPAAVAEIPDSGLVWAPQSVRYPVDPEAVTPAPPFVPDGVKEVTGTVEVGPGRGAAFYMDGLEIARIRVVSGEGTPRFRRVFGGSRSAVQTGLRAIIDTGAVKNPDGTWTLTEPAGDGDVWCIDAASPVRIQVEHPRTLSGGLAWEEARRDILSAIDRGTALPTLPGDQGSSALSATLDAQAALGAAILAAGGKDLEPAVAAWRKASALRALDEIRPFAWPYWSVTEVAAGEDAQSERILRVDGEIASTARWFRSGAAPVEVEVEGPGILRVQSRAVLPPGVLVAATPTSVRVERDGVLAATLSYTGRPARVTDEPNVAFPMREVLVTKTGEWAGKVNEVRVPLAPGVHRYRVSVDQAALVRLARAERKPFAAERLAGRASPEDWVDAGREALVGRSGPYAELLQGLIADVQGEAPPTVSAGLPRDLQVVAEYLAAAHGKRDPVASVLGWTSALAGTSAPPWAWWLRVQMAGLLPAGTGARALFASAVDLPPPGLLSLAAVRLGAPGLYQDRPDRALGALELAWRGQPGDVGIRSDYLREFLDGSSWSRLSPVVLVNGDAITPPPLTWLDTAAATGGPISKVSRVYYRIPAGATRTYSVAPSPANPDAPALLTTYLRSAADVGRVGLRVDDRPFRALPLADVERLDLAVPVGQHTVTLDAPAGTDAWVSALPDREEWRLPQDIATVRSYWPTAIRGAAPRFEIPAPSVPVPVRVELRALDPQARPRTVEAHVRTDTGADWPVTIVPGFGDPTLLPIGGEAPLSSVASITVYVPAGTTTMWVDAPSDAGLVVSMSVRRDEESYAVPPRAANTGTDMAALRRLGEGLLTRRNDPTLLLQRAELLADLGDTDMARQDLRRLLRLGEDARAKVGDEAILTVSERIDGADASAWLTPAGDLASLRIPLPLSPALLAGDSASPGLLAAVTTARTSGPAVALALPALRADEAEAAWVRGRLLRLEDHEVEGAMSLIEAWRRADTWQYGLEAAGWLVASEVGSGQAPTTGSGSVGYGLATALRDHIDQSAVDRLALLAGRRTRWDPLRGADGSAGRARVTSAEAFTPPLPQSEIREALTVAPWPAVEAQFVTAKEPAQITTETGAPVVASAWCQPLRLGEGGAEPGCTMVLAVDGVAVGTGTIAPYSVGDLTSPALPPGRHDIEVSIDDPGRTSALSVRFQAVGSRQALSPLRDSAAFLATAQAPYELAVAGPGTVYLEVRGIGGAGGIADIRTRGPSGALPDRAVVLDRAVDGAISVSSGATSTAGVASTATVVLPSAGTWTVMVTPRAGGALVRGALRQENAPPMVQRPGPMWRDVPAASEPFDWPAVTPQPAELSAGEEPMSWGLGTFSAGADFGRQDLGETGTTAGATLDQLQTSLAWRLQALPRRLWLHLEPAARFFEGNTSTGISGDALVRFLAPDLRLLLSGQLYSQAVGGAAASGTEESLRVYRPFRLGTGAYLIPSLTGLVRGQSLDAAPVGVQVDPDVFSTYAAAHPFGLRPEVMYWGMPAQDVVGYASLSATTNANVASLDQLGLTLVGRAVLHPGGIPPVALDARYRPSYRFADDDRAAGYLRQGIGGDVGAYVRLGQAAGMWIAVGDEVDLTSGSGAENLFQASARFDFSGGRGLNDMLPVEQDFFDLLASDRWGVLDEDLR